MADAAQPPPLQDDEYFPPPAPPMEEEHDIVLRDSDDSSVGSEGSSAAGEVDGGGGEPVTLDDDDDDRDGYYDFDYDPDLAVKPLFKAIRKKKPLSVLQAIVEQHPESIRGTCFADYPLCYAVQHGLSLAHVKYLYDLFPDAIKDTEPGRRLPLHFIGDETPVETVQFLVGEYPEALLLEDDNRRLPIHAGIDCHCSLDVLQVLVERCPESILEHDGEGRYPIHLAVTSTENPRQLEVLRYLARHRPASLLQRTDDDDDGYLPIHLAATEKGKGPRQLNVIQFLAGACPESLGVTASGGNLPVHVALKSNVTPGVVQLLVGLVHESIPEETRLGLLHSAIRFAKEAEAANERMTGLSSRNLDFLRNNVAALVEAHPATLRAQNWEGSLPIHVAVDVAETTGYSTNLYIARLLAEQDRGSLLLPNTSGDLPLHFAIIRNDHRHGGHMYLADFLLERCPEAARERKRDGNRAIHEAIKRGMFGLVRDIVRLVPDTASSIGAGGRTPLHFAVTLPRSSYRGPRRDDPALDIVELLVESSPGSLLVPDLNGDLPVHVAISSPSQCNLNVELVTALLDRSPQSIREAGSGGSLPLHLAVSKSPPPLPLVRLLVNRWLGSVEVRDAGGNLPVHVAILNSWAINSTSDINSTVELVTTLLDHCPHSIREAGADGRLPILLAVTKIYPSLPLVRLLVERWTESLEEKDAEGNVALVLAAANDTAPLDLIYWLARAKPDFVAPPRQRRGTKRRR